MEKNVKVYEGMQAIVTQLSQQADQHAVQSRVFASEGFSKLADKYAEHAEEERGYVKQCVDRLLDVGCEVKLGAVSEVPVCKDPVEFIKYDMQVSKDGLEQLACLVEVARPDYKAYDILVEYYKDEEEDLFWDEQQLDLIQCIGKENWLVQQL